MLFRWSPFTFCVERAVRGEPLSAPPVPPPIRPSSTSIAPPHTPRGGLASVTLASYELKRLYSCVFRPSLHLLRSAGGVHSRPPRPPPFPPSRACCCHTLISLHTQAGVGCVLSVCSLRVCSEHNRPLVSCCWCGQLERVCASENRPPAARGAIPSFCPFSPNTYSFTLKLACGSS